MPKKLIILVLRPFSLITSCSVTYTIVFCTVIHLKICIIRITGNFCNLFQMSGTERLGLFLFGIVKGRKTNNLILPSASVLYLSKPAQLSTMPNITCNVSKSRTLSIHSLFLSSPLKSNFQLIQLPLPFLAYPCHPLRNLLNSLLSALTSRQSHECSLFLLSLVLKLHLLSLDRT
jgi:hypothetical protein